MDKQKDRSPDGTVGQEGNVSEWTASWSEGNKFPIIKGGNFSLPLMPLGDRIDNHAASPGEEFIGFRTISPDARRKNSATRRRLALAGRRGTFWPSFP